MHRPKGLEKKSDNFCFFDNLIVTIMRKKNLNYDSPHKREQAMSLIYKALGKFRQF